MARRPTPRDGARPRPGGREIARKLIHIVASIAAAAVALEAPAAATPWIFLGTFVLAIVIEEARRRNAAVGRVFDRAVGGMLRPRERSGTTGATTLAAGFAIVVILLPPTYAAIGIAVGGIGDAAAALAGGFLGRHRLRSGKSLEGGLACLVVSALVAWAMPGMGLAPAVVTAAAATAFELAPIPYDDNLWLAPAAGLVAWAAAAPFA
ncbi:MAG TPA: hypothetical protein VF158_01990 [Longimicrobiales bacterium]